MLVKIFKVHIKPAEKWVRESITIWNGNSTIKMFPIKDEIYRTIEHRQACYMKNCKDLELRNLVEMIIESQNDRLNLRLAWEIIHTLYNK